MDNNSAAERLAGLLQTQDLVRRIVARMLHVQADAVDEAVAEGLAALGEHLSVDRAYVFLFQGETMRNTHEWCAEGIPAEIENLQTVPVEAFAFWMDRLHAGDSVSVGNVDTLPDHRRAEREILKAQAIRSLAVVPMFSLGALVGFVGFDAVRALREFHEGEINLLRAVADGIKDSFGNYQSFRKAFSEAGATQFGSGWAWLVSKGGKLEVRKTANAETPLTEDGVTPLLTMDVWEHAYYLDFQNARPKYIETFLDNLVNWDFANQNLSDSK